MVINPKGSGRPSATLHVSWLDYPKSDRTKQAVAAVTVWAKNKYRGCNVFVEAGSLTDAGEPGAGHIHVNGMEVADFSAVAIPAPVPAESLFGGGL
ncbi:hypothetical protein AA310_00635 [Arthrobacter sp. YC-RL1]|nr:hypothetical protein ATC04_00060 [Arthrobacter sp. YC-RL1]ALQ32185.1 hypothetical protein ATC04_17690 [Arthrobacter sp. YC-RL1]KLI90651.1 hypothetical protein AA310_00635 [Arthrobacter sp. YC-RL1]